MSKRDAESAQLDHASATGLHPEVLSKLKFIYDTTPVQDGDLTENTLSMLNDFDVESAVKILEEYGKSNFEKIRNRDAYLRGTIKKRRKVVGNYTGFAYNVQQQIDRLYDKKIIKLGDLDDRCWDALRTLDETIAQRALQRFIRQKREKEEKEGDIRNLSAFFMAQIKQVEKDARITNPRGTSNFGGMGGGMGAGMGAGGMGGTLGGGIGGMQPNMYAQVYGGGLSSLTTDLLGMPSLLTTPMIQLPNNIMGLTNYAMEQVQLGVRVVEFHNLSEYATYVHPAAARKLQDLWDSGVNLLSQLDAKSWEALANMNGEESLYCITETASMLDTGRLRNLNAFFMAKARPQLQKKESLMGMSGMSGVSPMTPMFTQQQNTFGQQSNGFQGRLGNGRNKYVRDGADSGGGRGRGRGRGGGRGGGSQGDRNERKNESKVSSYNQQSYLQQQPQIVGLEQKPKGKGDQRFLQMLPESVMQTAQILINKHSGHMSEANFDVGVVQALKALPEDKANEVLSQLQDRDLSSVQNISGYITGICRTAATKGQ